MAKKFSELRAKMSPERQEANAAATQKMLRAIEAEEVLTHVFGSADKLAEVSVGTFVARLNEVGASLVVKASVGTEVLLHLVSAGERADTLQFEPLEKRESNLPHPPSVAHA